MQPDSDHEHERPNDQRQSEGRQATAVSLPSASGSGHSRRRNCAPTRRKLPQSLTLGITLADRGQGSDADFGVCQSETVGVMEVRHQQRFGTDGEAAAAQIRTLIDSISRNVQSLNYDIEAEEERTGCWDCRDAAYSVLARSLTVRRDNLAATIAALQERLAGGEALTYAPIGSKEKLLLPM